MAKIIKKNKAANEKEFRDSLHHFHRQRMKETFRKSGFSGFMYHNMLEMMLFYSIPRKNTNETAHMLINEFGSFAGVLDAPIESLQRINGVGIETATYLKMFPEVFRAYEESKQVARPVILSSDSAAKYLKHFFVAVNVEKFVVLYLDGNGKLIKEDVTTQYATDYVHVNIVSILQSAVSVEAKTIVIAHNHNDGFAVPSEEDIKLTNELASKCAPLKIALCDHILFAGNEVCSFSKSKKVKAKYFLF